MDQTPTNPVPPPTTPHSPDPSSTPSHLPRTRRWLPASPEGWLIFILGLGLTAYGVTEIVMRYQRTGKGSLFGLILVLAGVTMLPYRLVGLVCGVGLVGIGVYLLINNYSMLLAAMVIGFGILSIMERTRSKHA